jgi:hypothetical protein
MNGIVLPSISNLATASTWRGDRLSSALSVGTDVSVSLGPAFAAIVSPWVKMRAAF